VTWQLASIVPVWLLSIAAAVVVAVLAASDASTWLAIALAGAVILAFAIQLAIQKKDGFVLRIMASVTGAVVVLGVTTAVLLSIA
jgi:hypothetical protein